MYSKGVSWINDVRIPIHSTDEKDDKTTQGRFPANLLVSDDMLNDGVISKSTIWKNTLPKISGNIYRADGNTNELIIRGCNDKGSNSRYYDIDKWFNNLIDEI